MEPSEQLQMWFEAGANATGVAHIPIADIAEVQRELAQLEKEKEALIEFEGLDAPGILRAIADEIERTSDCNHVKAPHASLARRNWLYRFATHLESLRV